MCVSVFVCVCVPAVVVMFLFRARAYYTHRAPPSATDFPSSQHHPTRTPNHPPTKIPHPQLILP